MSATPKTPARARAAAAPAAALASAPTAGAGLLDAFPVWSDAAHGGGDSRDAPPDKYEDPLGTTLPPSAAPFCDAFKRPEELLQGAPAVPIVCLRPPLDVERGKGGGAGRGAAAAAAAAAAPRELEGRLFSGHAAFDWLLGAISHVLAAERHLRRGECLWELIAPRDKDGAPTRSPSGRYRVKLFLLDTWRAVTVDDRIPVDLFGRPLLVGSRPLQLWPLLLCKALLKVSAVHMLTGWPQEDLLDPLAGPALAGGELFDRLEEALGGPLRHDLPAIASCCLVRRSKPQRAPPRLVVLSGASGVGRAALVERLLAEFPDRFGATVSHTTRPPRLHEVDGRDYRFTDKASLLAGVRARRFLEAARVTVHARPAHASAAAAAAAAASWPPVSHWFGTSLNTVREVAASGKLCIMSLDAQGAAVGTRARARRTARAPPPPPPPRVGVGPRAQPIDALPRAAAAAPRRRAQALRSNARVDGLYIYLAASSPDALAARQRSRRAEPPSTLAQRLAWARAQVAKAAAPGLFDALVPNTTLDEAYAGVKEAISALSPVIRNRLRGLPAYVLDYADLIPPNSVEQPFLKPVVLAGPHTGERTRLLEMLAAEFPDVFALPRRTTTRDGAALAAAHLGADGDEAALGGAAPGGGGGGGGGATPRPGTAGGEGPGGGAAAAAPAEGAEAAQLAQVLGPPPEVLSREEFEAAAAGGRLLEAHADLFTHPLVTHRHGHSHEAVREVIKSGKLPLLELEAEGAEALRARGVDCLAIFLSPPSIEAHAQRLEAAATESEEEIAQRGAVAAAELAAARSGGVVVVDDVESGYAALRAAIGRARPDLIPPPEDGAAAEAARRAAANQPVPLIVFGPAGGGREALAAQLLARFPLRFATPRRLTDRKPGRGEAALPPDVEVVRPDALTKLGALGALVHSAPDGGGGTLAVHADALLDLAAAGKMSVVDIGAATLEQLAAVRQHPAMRGAFAVLVSRRAALAASLAAAGAAEAAAVAQLDRAAAQAAEAATALAGLVQAVVSHDDPEEAFAQLQEPLSVASPWVMPPLLQPLVLCAPFGSGKRAVLARLLELLPDTLALPRIITTQPRPPGAPDDMVVVSPETAVALLAEGKLLAAERVGGHVYGVPAAAVRKLQASGRLPVLDLDRTAEASRLRGAGFAGTYVCLQPPSLEGLRARVAAGVLANPPPQHDPAAAAAAAADAAAAEAAAAAAAPELFDAVLQHDPDDLLSTVGRLSELLQRAYPAAIPSSFVWGFGRPLWDAAARRPGRKPLRLMMLGPAASGKSTQCAALAARFGVPHVNAGELLFAEVAARTPLGLEAKAAMEASRTVPDRLLLGLVLRRLAAPDCQAVGWALDGFPHTRKQAAVLAEAGHEPDKVIMLEGPHALLLDRAKHRRVDYATGAHPTGARRRRVYHLAGPGALSEAVRPLRPDGSPDADALARLAVRHDDSPGNVARRLALWDRQAGGLRAAYCDVLLRLPAGGALDETTARAEAFVRLEAATPCAPAPGSVWPLVASHSLEEHTYRVVATLRYKRQQLVQLQQLDGRLAWCELSELAGNASCLLLAHNPAGLPVARAAKRLDGAAPPRPQLLFVESPEPVRLIVSLAMAPQHAALLPPPPPKQVRGATRAGGQAGGRAGDCPCGAAAAQGSRDTTAAAADRRAQVFVLAGPAGAGRACLARQLLCDFSSKLAPAALLTTQPPHVRELARGGERARGAPLAADAETSDGGGAGATAAGGAPPRFPGSDLLQFVPEAQFRALRHSGHLEGAHEHLGDSHGLAAAALEAAAAAGKAALVVGSVRLAQALRRELQGTHVVCVFVDAGVASQDARLRQAGTLEEARLQELLADAGAQRELLHGLLAEQAEAVREEAAAAAAAANAAAAAALALAAPPTPLGAPKLGASVAGGGAGTPSARTSAQHAALAAGLQQQAAPAPACAAAPSASAPPPATWLHVVPEAAGQGRYALVKAALAAHWPRAQQHLPGLLLVQRHAAARGAAVARADGGARASETPRGKPAQQASAVSDAGLDDDGFASAVTVLRLRARTASAAALTLPRGRHLLSLACPPALHAVSVHGAAEFALDDEAKLLPLAAGLHAVSHDGAAEGLAPGARTLLFRFLLRPSEPCTASFELRAASPALAAAAQLLLAPAAPGAAGRGAQCGALGGRLADVPLAPGPDKAGYVLLCLAEPQAPVPASAWSLAVTSSRPLPALADLAPARVAAFEGTYAPNVQAVVARFVLAPTAPVQLAVLAQLTPPQPGGGGDCGPPSPGGGGAGGGSCSDAAATVALGALPPAFSLQLWDTCGAKEVVWGASGYRLAAEAAGGAHGRAALPSVQLAPGRYIVALQLRAEAGRQWVDPCTGATEPPPGWQLTLLPSADDKVCPITRDDAWERHFRATAEAWQAAAAHGPSGRPGSSGVGGAAGARAAAAARDRPRLAQAALERHAAAEAGPVAAGLTALSIGGSQPAPGGAAAAGGAARRSMPGAKAKAAGGGGGGGEAAGSAGGSLQATPRAGSGSGGAAGAASGAQPGAVLRQVQSGEPLLLAPERQVVRRSAPPSGEGAAPVVLGPAQLAERLQALQATAERGAAQLGGGRPGGQRAPGALQAKEAEAFAEWRSAALAAQAAAAARKAEVLAALAAAAPPRRALSPRALLAAAAGAAPPAPARGGKRASLKLPGAHNAEGQLVTDGFLDVCQLVCPVIDQFGSAFALVKNDISHNIERLRTRFLTDPLKFELLFAIIEDEVERDDHAHSRSCTKGLLWLKRALEFMMAIMQRLLADPGASMSDVVYETYHATLHRWHGFIASSAFNVAFHFVPSREAFMEKVAGAADPGAADAMARFVADFSPLLAEVHAFLDARGLDDPAKV
ncbi:GLTP1 [Scenedesmus sp. PABB004]|nr:GLTP1 [Scenedesmus sp. PABB004]